MVQIRLSSSGREGQAETIQTMALAGRFWPVIEDVSKVAAATAAMHFGSDLKDEMPVLFCADGIGQALIKTWPAGFAVIFGACVINAKIAPAAMIDACAGFVIQRAGKGALCLFLAEDKVFIPAQPLAPLSFAATNLKAAIRGVKGRGDQGRPGGNQKCSAVHVSPVLNGSAWASRLADRPR